MNRIRVLLVDRDPESGTRTGEALSGVTARVSIVAHVSPAGLESLGDRQVDCAVLVSDGSDWATDLEAVRSRVAPAPVVLFTDSGSETLAGRAVAAGADGYVSASAEAEPIEVLAERVVALGSAADPPGWSGNNQVPADDVFELVGSLVLSLAPDGTIERISKEGASFLGVPQDQLEGADWFEVAVPSPDREDRRGAFESLLAGDRDGEDRERSVVAAADGHRTIEWRNEVLRDESGAPVRVLRAGRDVTEQAAQARAVAAERDRFAALFENIPEPAIVASFEDGKPIVKRLNREFERVFGFGPEEVVGRNVDEFIVPESERDVASDLNQDLTGGHSVQTEATRLTASGPRDFRLHVVPLQPGTENVEGYAIYEDITDLKQRQRILEGLHGAATEVVGADSASEACQRTVEAARELLAFDLSEISLEEDGYLVPVAASEDLDETTPTTVSVEEGVAGETYRTGESILVEDLTTHPEAKPQGEFRSAISVPIGDHGVFQATASEPGAFDETDLDLAELLVSHTAETLTRLATERALREREETLQRQNDRLEKFTKVLSHDLRNPLNVAAGQLELAMEDGDLERLETVSTAHDRMRELVEDVLTLARQDQRVTDTEPIDLSALLESCFGTVDTADADLQVDLDRPVLGDRPRLRSLFENLFRNAVQHGGEGVTIRVGRLPEGFFVADDGPGIPADVREDVLEPGYTTHERGTGLGLSIVSETAAAHDWQLSISQGSGGGARFEFTGVQFGEPQETA